MQSLVQPQRESWEEHQQRRKKMNKQLEARIIHQIQLVCSRVRTIRLKRLH